MKSIKDIKNLKGKRVLVRVDFNVSLTKSGEVGPEEAFKIEAVLPTIKYLLEKKAKIILMTHLGRPNGRFVAKLKIDPVADYLSLILKKLVKKTDACAGPPAEKAAAKLKEGEILMLENLRFEKGEGENSEKFAGELVKIGDVYVNDAFAACHRPAASLVAITKYIPSCAGLLLEAEISALSKVMKNPRKPLVLIMGGLKFETKMPVIEKFLARADKILLGGGLASTCLAALGYGVGGSAIDKEYLAVAKKIARNKKILLPQDVIAARPDDMCDLRHLPVPARPRVLAKPPYAIYDVGPATIRQWAKIIKKAGAIVWNGPLGHFEIKPYDSATLAVARLVASRAKGRAFGVAGGGETVTALRQSKMAEFVDHVSTGGGAMLEFLAGKKLPGLEALR